jgi:uncharacterized protein
MSLPLPLVADRGLYQRPRFRRAGGWAAVVDSDMPLCYLSRMSLDPKLLEVLACPVCKLHVNLLPDNGGLRCEGCRRVYPVVDDIPIMLIDEAVGDPPPEESA